MSYTVRQVVGHDNGDQYFPKRSGHWEVRNAAGKVVYRFDYEYVADLAEWDDRERWQGPKQVRISADGSCVECVMQKEVNSKQEVIQTHPLPPA